jgi:uncharacterized protein
MRFIDCNCGIGYSVTNHVIVNHENMMLTEKVREAKNASDLIEQMDYCSIDSAIVYHQTMIDVAPEYGNKKLTEEVQNYKDRLISSWTILPPITEGDFNPEKLFPDMKNSNVKALRAYPNINRYFLNDLTMGDLLNEVSIHKIPLFLSPNYGYEYIYSVLNEFPDLTVIIYGYGPWSPDRYIYPLLKKYKNVFIETGDYQTDGGFRRLVNTFGSERLLFGTGFPVNNMGGSIGVLLGSRIAENEKENIAAKNIIRILAEVTL